MISGTSWTHLLARPLVRPLIGTWVRPNHLTTLRLLTGLAACVAVAWGSRAGLWWGGGLWLVSAFLDRADGELARMGKLMSPGGHLYDYYTDNLVSALFFVAIGAGLRHSWLGHWAAALGLWSGAALFLCNIFSEWLEQRSPPGTRAFAGKWGFDADDALYLMGPVVWIGWLAPVLIAAAFGTTLMMTINIIRMLRLPRLTRDANA
jgi:archaetidylinositol phosphate synthase